MESQKRVLIVTQYFYPENFRINELAYELVKDGYVVDALVGIPNYPKGKFFEGYGVFKKRRENKNGVNIYRCFQLPRGTKSSNIRLSLNYISFVISATLWVLFIFALKKKYDAIISFEPSPITQIIPAIILGKLRKTRVLSWIQDIWPDSIIGVTSDKQRKFLLPVLKHITEYVYRHSDKLLVSSPGMKELICRNHDYSKKIEYVPNWCDDFLNGDKKGDVPIPIGFNLMMAGSINDGIGIDDLVNLLEALRNHKDINIVFIGGGSRKDYLETYKKNHHLDNVYVLGMYPYEMMPYFYSKADAMLLTLALRKEKHLDVTIPSRLQSYLSGGKPVFAMIGTGAKNVIEEAKCGCVVSPGEYKALAELIIANYKKETVLKEWGNNARTAYEKYFTIEAGTKHFEKLIND